MIIACSVINTNHLINVELDSPKVIEKLFNRRVLLRSKATSFEKFWPDRSMTR